MHRYVVDVPAPRIAMTPRLGISQPGMDQSWGVAGSLTRLQRMLVGTDGTLTHMLEAYADEPIEVEKLFQAYDTATERDAALALARGARVLRRRVVLRGRHSGRNLLYAEAVVAVERVSASFLDDLMRTDKPLGVLLRDHRTETLREILAVGFEPAGSSGVHFGIGPDDEAVFRTYRVVAATHPIIAITERFPADYFRSLAD